MESLCHRCRQPFEHPRGRFTVCPPCKSQVAKAAKRKWHTQAGSLHHDHDENWIRKLCVKSASEVGELCGLSRDQVLLIERRAIRKLREQKHVLEAARDEISIEPIEAPLSDLDLLDFQISVGEWWAMADHFADLGKETERQQCIAEIGKFQKNITNYLTAALS